MNDQDSSSKKLHLLDEIAALRLHHPTINGIDDLEDLGKGPLCLGIYCTSCGAQFELNVEAFAIAAIKRTLLLEYVKFVQSSRCPACGKLEEPT